MKHADSDAGYQPVAAQSRFGVLGWLYLRDESCYTPGELAFREHMLEARRHSGIDSELLETTDSFFAPALKDAFVDVNADSYFFGSLYRPKHLLTREAFRLSLTNHRKLRWQTLETLAHNLGDYLQQVRNNDLSAEHLNQPVNYLLLDVARITRRLAQHDDPEYVSAQVGLLERYISGMEVHLEDNDRLFLADFRETLEREVTEEIQRVMRSRFLKLKLEAIRQQVRDIAEDHHALLHFSLTHEPVNSHPYLEYLETLPDLDTLNLEKFPTLAASLCAGASGDSRVSVRSEEEPPTAIDANTLTHCEALQLPPGLPPDMTTTFARALADVHELLRFDRILRRLLHLLEQAGEVLTRLKFREEIDGFLLDVETFIQHSVEPIRGIRTVNRAAYQHHIASGRQTGPVVSLFAHHPARTSAFLQNQDSLILSTISRTPMPQTQLQLTQHIHEVRGHLRESALATQEDTLLENTRQMAEQLMDDMHHWRAVRNPGLPAPTSLALPAAGMPTPLPFHASFRPPHATSAAVLLAPGLALLIPLAILTVMLLGYLINHWRQYAKAPAQRFFQPSPETSSYMAMLQGGGAGTGAAAVLEEGTEDAGELAPMLADAGPTPLA